jgi:hypothetical protein
MWDSTLSVPFHLKIKHRPFVTHQIVSKNEHQLTFKEIKLKYEVVYSPSVNSFSVQCTHQDKRAQQWWIGHVACKNKYAEVPEESPKQSLPVHFCAWCWKEPLLMRAVAVILVSLRS